MNDERIDQIVRDADPLDPHAVRDLRGAHQELLDEIVATSVAGDELGRLRLRRRALTGVLVAAAVAAVAVSIPALRDEPDPTGPGGGQTVAVDGKGDDTFVYTAAAVEVAENNPRLLIDEPGWKVTTVYGFAKDEGTINFANGDREIEMNWYPADSYQGYYDDRTPVSKREPITIDGQPGSRVSYSSSEIAAMLEPDGPAFVEIHTAGFDGPDEILATFAKIKHVDVETWLAALPPEVVVRGEAMKAVDEILADVPLPPGYDRAGVEGVNSRYHFAAELIDRVECGWLSEWQRAYGEADDVAIHRSVAALKSARDWAILDEMAKTGEFSEGPWQIGDRARVGDDPTIYREQYGRCDQ